MSGGLFDDIELPEHPEVKVDDARLSGCSKYERHLLRLLSAEDVSCLLTVKDVFPDAQIIQVTKQ